MPQQPADYALHFASIIFLKIWHTKTWLYSPPSSSSGIALSHFFASLTAGHSFFSIGFLPFFLSHLVIISTSFCIRLIFFDFALVFLELNIKYSPSISKSFSFFALVLFTGFFFFLVFIPPPIVCKCL